jgi:two-component system sensor histidine kinase BaeS
VERGPGTTGEKPDDSRDRSAVSPDRTSLGGPDTRGAAPVFNIVTGGAATAFAGALLVAYIVSRLLVTQAQSLSRGIERLAAGDREVVFPQEGPRELLVIAQSARALRDQLANEEQLRKRWTEDIAHDLRTPITALKTQFEGITDGYITMTPQRLEDLKNELNHVERLVNDLRELSWVESPEMHLEKTRVELRTFVGNVTTVFTGRSKKLAVPFHVVSEDGTIEADEYLLQRALTNVIDNAFRYVALGGSVHISGRLSAGRSVFVV